MIGRIEDWKNGVVEDWKMGLGSTHPSASILPPFHVFVLLPFFHPSTHLVSSIKVGFRTEWQDASSTLPSFQPLDINNFIDVIKTLKKDCLRFHPST